MEPQSNPGPGEQGAEAAAAQFARRTETTGTPEAQPLRPPDESTAALDALGQKREQDAAAAAADRTSQMHAKLSPEALDDEHGHIGPRPEASQNQQPPAGPELPQQRDAA